MLGELLSQRPTGGSGGINGIVDGNLPVLVVKPGIDVFSALLQNLLPEHDGSRRRIGVEIVLRNGATLSNRGTAIVAQMKDAGFDPEPIDHQEKEGQAGYTALRQLTTAGSATRTPRCVWGEVRDFRRSKRDRMVEEHLRLSTSRETDHHNRDTTRVEESARHSAIELGRRQVILVIGNIVNSIYEGGTLPTISRRIRGDLSSTITISNSKRAAFSLPREPGKNPSDPGRTWGSRPREYRVLTEECPFRGKVLL